MAALSDVFMTVAREMLDPETFEKINVEAVSRLRKRIEEAPSLPAKDRVDKPVVIARVQAHLDDLPPPPPMEKPHAAERMEERFGLEIGPNDIGELLRIVIDKGPNVTVLRKRMDCVETCQVRWRGKEFVVLWNLSQRKLITAYPSPPKVRRKVFVGGKGDIRERRMGRISPSIAMQQYTEHLEYGSDISN